MKKAVVVVFSVMAVLFVIFNNLALADDVRSLTDKECQKIIRTIPPDAKRTVLEITCEELMLPPCVYWIFGKEERFRAGCLKSTTFLPLPPGVYVLYTIMPEKVFLNENSQ